MAPRSQALVSAPPAPASAAAGSSAEVSDVLVGVERALTRMMRQATRPAFYRALMAAAGTALDRADYAVVVHIDERAPVRLTDLAEVLGVDISTVSRQVRDLERSGLVERSGDPDDQRASRLRLTAQGQEVLTRVRAARQESMKTLLTGWSREDLVRLTRLVGRLADGMEMMAP